ncbi:MAG TPA: ribonuclease III [Thermomicrobiales bacterium]|nr:ribonuclease III [Thermomicrobiales bacterium]
MSDDQLRTAAEPTSETTRLAQAEASLGVRFRDPALLRRALTHRSYVNEQAGEAPRSNERQEFLGDALLGFLVADTLFRRFPDAPEGDLTAWRVALIRTDTLAHWARGLGLGAVLYLSKGDSEPDELSDRVLANAFEAVLAAIYLDGGLRAARSFMARRLVEADAIIARLASENYKGRLQELAQDPHLDLDALGLAGADRGRRTPVYVTVARGAPATDEAFTVEVRIDGLAIGAGRGSNKRLAEQAAARDALARIEAERGAPDGEAAADVAR